MAGKIGRIRIRRGLEADLPALAVGELAYTIDTFKFFVGATTGNQEISGLGDALRSSDLSQFAKGGSVDTAITDRGGQTFNVKSTAFGAVINGTTDDAAAIGLAITAALVNGGEVFVPAGTCKIASLVTIPNGVSWRQDPGSLITFTGSGGLLFDSQINGKATGIAVTRSTQGWGTGADTTSVAVKFKNCLRGNYDIRYVAKAAVGILFQGDSTGVANPGDGGCSWNVFHIAWTRNCKIHLQFLNIQGATYPGYCNANRLYGGWLEMDSAQGSYTGTRLIDLSHAPFGGDGNTFIGFDLSDDVCELTVQVASAGNAFLDCRYENIPTGHFQFEATSFGNYVWGGYPHTGKDDVLFNDLGTANVILGTAFSDYATKTGPETFQNKTIINPAIYKSSPVKTWVSEQVYGGGYVATKVGNAAVVASAIALGVDLTANPSTNFSAAGNDIFIPNAKPILAPNAANNDYLHILSIDSSNNCHFGNVGSYTTYAITTSTAGVVTIPNGPLTVSGGIVTVGNTSTVQGVLKLAELVTPGFMQLSPTGQLVTLTASGGGQADFTATGTLTGTAGLTTGGVMTSATAKVGSGAAISTIPNIVGILGASQTTASGSAQLAIVSTDAQAADKGASIAFGGRIIDSDFSTNPFALIAGRKENSTTSNIAGYLSFATQGASGSMTESFRIDSTRAIVPASGTFTITGSIHVTSAGTFDGALACFGLTNTDGLNTKKTVAATNTTTNVVTIGCDSSGTPAASFGSIVTFALKDSTTNGVTAAQITTTWTVATHSSTQASWALSIAGPSGQQAAITVTAGAATATVSMPLVNVTTAITNVGGSTSGSADFTMPFQGSAYKRVAIYCNALLGTAAFNFPTAWTHTPVASGPNSALATSISVNSVTVTGSTSTGWLFLDGF